MTRRMPRLASALVAATLLLGVAPALAGCSVIEGIIEQQTGADVELGGNTVPADFPAEVPLASGEVINGSAATGANGERVWNVLLRVADPDAPATISAQLEGAGFGAPDGVGGVGEQGGTLAFANGTYVVNVLLAKIDGGWTANYTVARAG